MQPISDVFNINCLDYMRGLPDNAFELVIADPPYGDAGSGTLGASGQHKHIKLDSTSKKDRMFKYRKLPPPATQSRNRRKVRAIRRSRGEVHRLGCSTKAGVFRRAIPCS